ncbi:hypothetical protein, partial [Burkholderia sp. BCC0405]|uniref:hypothetical protein n=1 Tax=Burkholderia sp. BCC0405 TaxID=2676298 RepID=UPI001ABBD055
FHALERVHDLAVRESRFLHSVELPQQENSTSDHTGFSGGLPLNTLHKYGNASQRRFDVAEVSRFLFTRAGCGMIGLSPRMYRNVLDRTVRNCKASAGCP